MLRLARGMVQAGRRVELEGLDQMVGRLCARCLDLPPEEGRALRPLLAALLVASLPGLLCLREIRRREKPAHSAP